MFRFSLTAMARGRAKEETAKVFFEDRETVSVMETIAEQDEEDMVASSTFQRYSKLRAGSDRSSDVDSDPESSTRESSVMVSGSEGPSLADSMIDGLMDAWAELHQEETIVIVDPYTAGATLAERARHNGYTVVSVLSDPESERARSASSVDWDSHLTIRHNGDSCGRDEETVRATVSAIRKLGKVHAVVAGAEEGVELSDRLATALGLPCNGPAQAKARRDKFAMQEAVKAAGVRACRQAHIFSTDEGMDFFRSLDSAPVVVKPLASMKSEDVFLCRTEEEVRKAFGAIAGKKNYLNIENEGALIQEYLDGEEYVVDATSFNGKHKVACCFHIDRKKHLGQFNVMFGARLMDYDQEAVAKDIVAYAKQVLDALEVTTGASHMELKLTSTGPCLIEMGARPCGDPISSLLDASLGQNHIQQTLDALLHKESFDAYPEFPPKPKLHARQSFVVSHFNGTVKSIPGLKALERLPSVRSCHLWVKPGDRVEVTRDQRTQLGFLEMWHPDKAVLDRDYEMIRKLEATPGALLTLA